MIGRIHSLETFGTVDGPGIRFILFMQGCALKCQYCHNRDTWSLSDGKEMTLEEVLAEIEPYLPYYRSSGGGLTVSGGEPTLQAAFVRELFREVKQRWDLHTTLDSNGFNDVTKLEELMNVTDLVLLDIKHINNDKHIALTGVPNARTLDTARWLSEHGKKMWIRHVFVPTINDDEEDLLELGRFIGTLQGVEKFEILPYHQMGVYKWEQLGEKYPLEGVPSPTAEEVERAYALIEKGRQQTSAS
ncbi:pyruvate formate-lyase-activating protein [Paenibacillus alvei]|uniref:Pyruvate formate-lyase-activating enzyme n=1 Tax=Paenibacillus alvei TaxID=44250 RepID=A0AAP7DG48_PAEAL|nr:pyruvate formate-lyase-activating protein [Paenibacillus alvei]MBG9733736.1 pyruvate formate lyase-activating protein [Paenibacillus alvei]MBG9745721.1 pyruvate formate lyase-activating protein [Paenibacillus alvei]MCY7483402.1 pyruvate formate-lyase-activating protein [Paenibacillus alvei]MCY9580451.1 pyruvate formate-lyase-activating protein [Paenibacillus alvei]MCY9583223.1 pyruvate formate-lyase-activating protein [Paenibacillus alvei]